MNNALPLSARLVLLLALFLAVPACQTKPVWKPQHRPDYKQRLTRGCIFYMDGAGGGTDKSNYAAGVVAGMLDAGYNGAGELVTWETGKGLIADQDASVEYKRAKASQAAASILKYKSSYPDARWASSASPLAPPRRSSLWRPCLIPCRWTMLCFWGHPSVEIMT
ncbi:hypothetical protein [Verrucomicrobium spinosum]|uniref:hypothetical protein n=1 Tax=Verrucomicrobium spinosum TaxID=2736 RepID=UPI0009461497|nr:hypothetical protein [Verrucomicrobium spinosum]